MARLSLGAALVVLALGGPLAADDEQVKWVKWEEARAKSIVGGKPVMVFVMTDLIPEGPPSKGLDRAWAYEAVRAYKDEFHFVKCTDLKLAKTVKAASKCEMIFFDPEEIEIQRTVVTTAAQIATTLKDVLTRYAPKPISWTPDAPAGKVEGRPMTVVLFGDDSDAAAEAVKTLEDRRVAGIHEKCLFVKIAYKRDSTAVRDWKINGAPTLLLLDSARDFGPKSVLERSSEKKSPREMKSFLIKGLLAVERARK